MKILVLVEKKGGNIPSAQPNAKKLKTHQKNTSAHRERAGELLKQRRSRLKPENTGVLLFLKKNLKHEKFDYLLFLNDCEMSVFSFFLHYHVSAICK